MKILITGATGFLGKNLMKYLIDDTRIKQIVAITRSRDSHPAEKVKVAKVDLSVPASLAALPCDFDAVIHLAGSYDFTLDYAANYLNNVISMTHLLTWLEDHNATMPVYHASTYAVLAGCWLTQGAEDPCEILPAKTQSYAYSKAVAERMLRKSYPNSVCYRLGMLVGDSEKGEISKIDGPYYFLRLFTSLTNSLVTKRLPLIPLPARPDSYVPIVPVDAAARVIHAGLFKEHTPGSLYGVFNAESILLDQLAKLMLNYFKLKGSVLYVPRIPHFLGQAQYKVTGIPDAVFDFTGLPQIFSNSKFTERFHDIPIPHFEDIMGAFFSGFESYLGRTPQ